MERARLGQIRSEFSARHFKIEQNEALEGEVDDAWQRLADTATKQMLPVMQVQQSMAEDVLPTEHTSSVHGHIGED